jgi:putative ABC transport system ATP-binding protein
VAVRIEDVRFRYETERFELAIDALHIAAAEPTAIIGPSGCGKTTLLRLIAGILRPNEGRVRVLDREISGLPEARVRAFRVQHIGLVFQEFELLEYLTAAENILLPFRVSHALRLTAETRDLMRELAEKTGIAHLLDAYPRRLSQGERQRVAICRALVTKPRVLLADEPTGSLDPANQQRIVSLLRTTADGAGAGLIMVTHEHELLEHFDRVIDLPTLTASRA